MPTPSPEGMARDEPPRPWHSSACPGQACIGHCVHVDDLLAGALETDKRLDIMEMRWSAADSTVEQANRKFGQLKARVEKLDRALQAFMGDAWEKNLATMVA